MRKRIDVLEMLATESQERIDILELTLIEREKRSDIFEKAVRAMQRKFEMLVQQIQRDANLIQAHEMKIAKLEAMHRDDYK